MQYIQYTDRNVKIYMHTFGYIRIYVININTSTKMVCENSTTVDEMLKCLGMALDISNSVEWWNDKIFRDGCRYFKLCWNISFCLSLILFKDALKLKWRHVHRTVNLKETKQNKTKPKNTKQTKPNWTDKKTLPKVSNLL